MGPGRRERRGAGQPLQPCPGQLALQEPARAACCSVSSRGARCVLRRDGWRVVACGGVWWRAAVRAGVRRHLQRVHEQLEEVGQLLRGRAARGGVELGTRRSGRSTRRSRRSTGRSRPAARLARTAAADRWLATTPDRWLGGSRHGRMAPLRCSGGGRLGGRVEVVRGRLSRRVEGAHREAALTRGGGGGGAGRVGVGAGSGGGGGGGGGGGMRCRRGRGPLGPRGRSSLCGGQQAAHLVRVRVRVRVS